MEARIELIGVAQMILSYVGLKPSPSGLVDPVREFCHLTMSTGLMSHMRMSPKNGRSLLWMMFSLVSQVCSRTLGLTSAS